MVAVSILIPAYKSDYLDRAILSARYQTFEDIEILVGDDTPDAKLEPIVKQVADPRVRYFHHGYQKGTLNMRALWQQAKGGYIKWLFDDDMLMPDSVGSLFAALNANPKSLLSFHERVFIDSNDKIIETPNRILQDGHVALVDRDFLVNNMVAPIFNFIGEPSNVMLRREGVDIDGLFNYGSYRGSFIDDVIMYLNVAEKAPIVAVGGFLSAFRRHGKQASDLTSPVAAGGRFEWEIVGRGEASAGNLKGAALKHFRHRLSQIYGECGPELPELRRLLANLGEFDHLTPQELATSPRYLADIGHACQAVAARRSAHQKRTAPQPKHCAVCEQEVPAWLAHPDVDNGNRLLMKQLEAVGSTLENYMCPRCQCNDRDRHLWLYLTSSHILGDASAKRVLHIAPEAKIEERIVALKPKEYIAGDLYPRAPHHRKINVEHLEFPDNYFDIIICNHVLEHVADPETALAELTRCLAPAGYLVAQTPYSPVLRTTIEMTKPAPEPIAVLIFGQNDHVRLFGADIADKFHAAGLSGDLYPHTTVLGDLDPETYGCNGREPFFLFAKTKPTHNAFADFASLCNPGNVAQGRDDSAGCGAMQGSFEKEGA